MFYNNVTRCVLNDGHASEFFAIELRRVSDKVALCPDCLFAIGIEVLANAINNST